MADSKKKKKRTGEVLKLKFLVPFWFKHTLTEEKHFYHLPIPKHRTPKQKQNYKLRHCYDPDGRSLSTKSISTNGSSQCQRTYSCNQKDLPCCSLKLSPQSLLQIAANTQAASLRTVSKFKRRFWPGKNLSQQFWASLTLLQQAESFELVAPDFFLCAKTS